MFDKISLAKKLSIGFGLVLVLLTSVGFIAERSLELATQGIGQYRELARDTNLTGRVQASLLMVRMNVKDFFVSGSDKDRQAFEQYWEKNQGFMAEAKQQIADPERARILADVDLKLKEYDKGFDQVARLQARRDELLNDILVPQGGILESGLTKILESARTDGDADAAYLASRSIRSLLLARLYVVKFLASSAAEDVAEVNQEFAAMGEELESLDRALKSSQARVAMKEVSAASDAYQDAFSKMVSAIEERNRIIANSLARIGPEVAASIEEVNLGIKAVQEKLGPELQAATNKAVTLILVLSGIAIALGVGVAFVITRAILRQMGGEPSMVVEVAKRVAEGDLDMDLPSRGEANTSLYAAIRLMVDKLKEKATLAQRIAEGDLTQDVVLASERDVLGKALQGMVANLNDVLGQIQISGEQIASGSGQVSDASQSLSQGATQQAASLEEISSSLTQLAAQTTTNAENAAQANQLATSAQTAAQQGGTKMESMVTAMGEINEAGQNISKIIKTIDEIAFQTNLLALNAAVEAARAGQHGKGFAVVAEEVRNLAARSAKAAAETSELIEGSVEKTKNGSTIANQTAEALQEIFSGISKTSDLVAEIAAASNEQAQGVTQISQGVEQIDSVTQQNTANAEEGAAAAEELSGQSESMKQMLARFVLKGQNNTNAVSWKQPTSRAPQSSASGWAAQPAPAQISLDDQEFGKF